VAVSNGVDLDFFKRDLGTPPDSWNASGYPGTDMVIVSGGLTIERKGSSIFRACKKIAQ
jgi:hypothetical protein